MTIFVLLACGVAAFIWTALYVQSIVSSAERSRTAAAANSPSSKTVPPPKPPTGAAVLSALLAQVHDAVWVVHTFDDNGEPLTGTAFAVASNPTQTFLLTSFTVVSAATYQPAPPVEVNQGSGPFQTVTLRNWDAAHDMALLVLNQGNQPVLRGSGGNPPSQGQEVYLVSGTGGPEGSITPGKLTVISAGFLDDTARQRADARGGPLIDASGNVLGMDSSSFSGAQTTSTSAGTGLAVPIKEACAQVLVCPGGNFPSAGG
ncbi:MAG: S1 family peptidase [Acidimicrobiales bacterium]